MYNSELKICLLKQYELYPKMQIQDMIKCIYQNEYAGGHFISNEKNALTHLEEELSTILPHQKPSQPFEEIGNGLVRLHLSALKGMDINPSTVNRFFVTTANSNSGNSKSFANKLQLFRQFCKAGLLPFSLQESDSYLSDYQKQGYPPVSHSKAFQEAYSPAYRVVGAEYRDFFKLFCSIDGLLKLRETVNIAIDGNCCAGKSTLALLLCKIYDCNLFCMDHFFLRPEMRTKERFSEAGSNVDYERFNQEVMEGLLSRRSFTYQTYDCKKADFGECISVQPKRLNIIEGAYSMHPTLIKNYDLKVFLAVGDREQKDRILKRNGALMQERFVNEWIPMENRYFNEMQIQKKCDLIFNTDRNC